MHTHTHISKSTVGAGSEDFALKQSVQTPAFQDKVPGAGELAHAVEVYKRSALWSLIAEKFLAWRERRYVARATTEMLALYRSVTVMNPNWSRRKRYQRVVMRRTGCDPTAANQILDAAYDSYAQWPSSRELTLCDVVHYLSVTEFLANHPGERWMHSSLTPVVASRVPRELCVGGHTN